VVTVPPVRSSSTIREDLVVADRPVVDLLGQQVADDVVLGLRLSGAGDRRRRLEPVDLASGVNRFCRLGKGVHRGPLQVPRI
jgi:hypothetical protein